MNQVDARTIMDSGLMGGELAVVLAIWSHADGAGKCWPSVGTLARRSGMKSPRGVQRVLKRLVARGVVSIEERPGRSAVYALDMEALPSTLSRPRPRVAPTEDTPTPDPESPPPPTLSTPTPDRGSPERIKNGSVEPIKEPVKHSLRPALDVSVSQANSQDSTSPPSELPPAKTTGETPSPTPRKAWDEFNALHQRFNADRIPLKYSRYSDDWRKCIRKAGDAGALLRAWECMLFGPDDWHRVNLDTGAKLVAAFLRPTKLAKKLTAADEWQRSPGDPVATTDPVAGPEWTLPYDEPPFLVAAREKRERLAREQNEQEAAK